MEKRLIPELGQGRYKMSLLCWKVRNHSKQMKEPCQKETGASLKGGSQRPDSGQLEHQTLIRTVINDVLLSKSGLHEGLYGFINL